MRLSDRDAYEIAQELLDLDRSLKEWIVDDMGDTHNSRELAKMFGVRAPMTR